MLLRYVFSVLLTLLLGNTAALKLAPISNLDDVAHVRTSSKRDASFTGDLDLQDVESFFWGAPAGNKLIYANLTVYFPEEYEYVVAMERFADKLKSVQCAEDMVLEFNDDAAFAYAKGVWNWVNDDVNHTFIMVTNYEGCADDMERLPFVVSNIRYDEAQNKAFLTADLKDWEEVAHSYTLNVGHMPLTPTHRMLMSRGLMPRGPDFSMDLTSAYDKNLFSATVGGWTTSVDAVIRTVGSLNVDFDIEVSWLKLKSAAMTITPEDVAASIQLALSEHGTLSRAYSWQKTVISIPIEGVEIAKVVKLGAFLDVDVGFTMDEWTGTATANLGARMALSNAATVKVDLVNSKNNKFSGWAPTFTPIPLTLSAKVEGSAKVFAEPNIKLEASALGKGWSVGLNLQMPYIQADFTAMAESSGVCDTKKTLGVDIDANIGVELSVHAATKGNEANPFWSQELYSNEWELFSKCMAFGPSNAHSGEVAVPNPPASKTKKSKSKTKTSKTKATKPATSKPPKSTKLSKTSATPTPTKHSSTKKSSSKKTTDDPTPTKAASSKNPASKHTPTDGATPSEAASSKPEKPSGTVDPSGLKSSSKSSASGEKPSGSVKPSGNEKSSGVDGSSLPSVTPTASDDSSSAKSSQSSVAISDAKSSASSASISDSTITLSVVSSSFSTLSWSNSSRLRTSKDDLSGSTTAPSATAVDVSSGNDQPSFSASATRSGGNTPTPIAPGSEDPASSDAFGSGTNTANPTASDDGKPLTSSGAPDLPSGSGSPTTPPPSSASSILSSLLSSSSASAEVCDISGRGCKDCKDSTEMDAPTQEYFAIEMEGDGIPDSTSNTTEALLKRATRLYKYVCGIDSFPISMAEYPTYKSRTERSSVVTVSDWYEAADSTDCLNHKITTTSANPPKTTTGPRFAAEHIYEGNWILNFLRFLHEEEGVSCKDMEGLFFTSTTTNNAGKNWAQALMESLGSHVNQDLLVFLRNNINGAKFRVFMDGNDMIAEKVFQKDLAKVKMEKIATVGRALDYLSQPRIGKILLGTAEKVEETLDALAKAAAADADLRGKLGKLGGEKELARKHRSWLNSFMETRNAIATDSIKRWASDASDAYVKETPAASSASGAASHSSTLKFLRALQTAAPTGFDAAKYAPLLPP